MPVPTRPKQILLHPEVDKFLKKNPNLADRYQKAFEKVLLGSHSSVGTHEEKVHMHFDGLSATGRVDQKARFFYTQDPFDKSTWMCIKAMPKHKEYEELAQKPASWLNTQIEKTRAKGTCFVVEVDEETVEEKEIETHLSIPTQVATNMDFCHGQGILLNNAQQGIKQKSLPLLVSGAAGSGKSTMLLLTLKEIVLKNKKPETRFLVLTESEPLLKELQDEWGTLCELAQIDGSLVEFKTSAKLYKNCSSTSVRNSQDFELWFDESIRQSLSHGLKMSPMLKELLAKKHLIYPECRSMSGYDFLEEYNNNVPNSYFICQLDRAFIWKLLQDYRGLLKTDGAIDYSFTTIPNLEGYAACFVDEAPDLSRQQLTSFGPNTLFCIGDHQQMSSREALIPFLNYHYWKQNPNRKTEHVSLSASYRCCEHIVDLANFILQMNYFATGGIKERNKHELAFIEAAPGMKEGSVQFLDKQRFDEFREKNKDNVDLSVVTSLDYLEEAQALFGKSRVFLPEKVKGLQSKKFLMYKVIGNKAKEKEYQQLNNLLKNFVAGETSSKSDSAYSMIFDELFVCITRGIEILYFYQPPKPGQKPAQALRNLNQPIKEFILRHNPQVSEFENTVSTEEDIQARIELLTAKGLKEQADALQQELEERQKPQTAQLASPPESMQEQDARDEDRVAREETKPAKTKNPTRVKNNAAAESKQQDSEVDKLSKAALQGDVTAIRDLFLHPKAHKILRRVIKQSKEELVPLITYLYNKNKLSIHFKKIFKSPLTSEQINCFADLIVDFPFLQPHLLDHLMNLVGPNLQKGDLTQVELYYKINGISKSSVETKILHAIMNGYIAIIEFLHRQGVKVAEIPVQDGLPALNQLLDYSRENIPNKLAMIEKLINCGADVNAQIEDSGSPLTAAVMRDQQEIVELLLKYKACPNQPVLKKGLIVNAPILAAALQGYSHILKYLLDNNARCDVQTPDGTTALGLAVIRGDQSMVELLLGKNAPQIDMYGTYSEWLKLTASLKIDSKKIIDHFKGKNISEDSMLCLSLQEIATIFRYDRILNLLKNNERTFKAAPLLLNDLFPPSDAAEQKGAPAPLTLERIS